MKEVWGYLFIMQTSDCNSQFYIIMSKNMQLENHLFRWTGTCVSATIFIKFKYLLFIYVDQMVKSDWQKWDFFYFKKASNVIEFVLCVYPNETTDMRRGEVLLNSNDLLLVVILMVITLSLYCRNCINSRGCTFLYNYLTKCTCSTLQYTKLVSQ